MPVADFISLVAPLLAPNKLILSDQNGTRPDKPYATISVRSIRPFRLQEQPVDAAGNVQIDQYQLNNVEIQVFGNNALDIANNLAFKLRFPSISEAAGALNIGISRIDRVLRVPELLNTSQFEERAILEFTAYDVISGSDNAGLIEEVEFNSTIENQGIQTESVFIVDKQTD